jgi:glycosyltransferase involved in cell wall biosynthesis
VISVITATHRNPDELGRAIASLEAQTYEDWQHVVVADGPDPELREWMHGLGYAGHGQRVFAELGRNWHGFLGGDTAGQPPGSPGQRGGRGSRGVSAYLAATYLAAGDWIGYLDSDCEYEPGHLQVHAKALEASGADFTYTQMRRLVDGQPMDVVGDGNPRHGAIDGNVVVHSAGLLRTANWEWGGDADWDLIGRWIGGGARWEFVPEVTVRWHHKSGDLW